MLQIAGAITHFIDAVGRIKFNVPLGPAFPTQTFPSFSSVTVKSAVAMNLKLWSWAGFPFLSLYIPIDITGDAPVSRGRL